MANPSPEVVVLAGAIVHTEKGHVERNQSIFISEGRITRIEPTTDVPQNVDVYDLRDLTVLPGLIDCHTHLTLPNFISDIVDEIRKSPVRCALEAIPNVRVKLHTGFTTVREAGAYWALVDVAVRDAINAGIIEGPRMLVPGAMITQTGGAGAMTGLAPEIELPLQLRFGQADSPAKVRERVRAVVSQGADVIKVFSSGAVIQHGCGCPNTCEFTEEELLAAVDESRSLGRRVMCHAHSSSGIRRAVDAGVISIEHGTMLDEESAELMKSKGVYLVPTLSALDSFGEAEDRPAEFLEKFEMVAESHEKSVRLAIQLGLKIAVGSDSTVSAHDKGWRELYHLVRLGMTPMQAIQAGTVVAAELLDVADIGSLAPGMQADIIAVRGDPTQNIDALQEVPFVMKGGTCYKNLVANEPMK